MRAIGEPQGNRIRALLVLGTALLVTAMPPGASGDFVPPGAKPAPLPSVLPASGDGGSLLHGPPAYDSGWTAVSRGSTRTLDHNLGGDADDYVVDFQFRDAEHAGSGEDVHQVYYGFDSYFIWVTGAYWKNLTSSQIKVVRAIHDNNAGEVRVRIWRVPTADHDSGWRSIDPGEDMPFTHSLGGDSDDYVVDLQFKSASALYGVHQLHYGGDRYLDDGIVKEQGAYWHGLGTQSIQVHRGADDSFSYVQEVRLRIWLRPNPDYDGGWRNLSPSSIRFHNLGGPWNDYVVDVQFRDTAGLGYLVNQFGYGYDIYEEPGGPYRYHGASWQDLSGHSITVNRGADDIAADHARVRIWVSRTPKYDSGWTAIGQGAGRYFEHNLGGNSDTYVMDLQFQDTGDGFGVNQRGYGWDSDYDAGAFGNVYEGTSWRSLTTSSVFISRFGDDLAADRVRVRLWIAPEPTYDSGWQPIGQGETITLSHGLDTGFNPDDFVVDLQFKHDGGEGVNQWWYGGDTYLLNGTTFQAYGAYWRALDDSDIVVRRLADDIRADKVRVRIWPNSSFDYASPWTSISAGGHQPFTFSLGACARDPVVDLQFFDSDDPAYGVNNSYYGGNALYAFGQQHKYGAFWQDLTSGSIDVHRGANDVRADQARVRIWTTQGCRVYLPAVIRGPG